MVNLYKLLNVLEQGMTLFQLNKWKTEGIWYPITQYKKESDEIQVVTNLFIPEQTESHIQFYSIQGIKEYFETVYIETQELTSVGFKTAIKC